MGSQFLLKCMVYITGNSPDAATDDRRASSLSERNDQSSWRRLTRPDEERPRAAMKAGSRLTKPSRGRGGLFPHQRSYTVSR
jgi:hypothetical protein